MTYTTNEKRGTSENCKSLQEPGILPKELTTIEVTIPISVVGSLDFIVAELQKEDKNINRNSVISNLIQNSFVGNINDGLKKFENENHEDSMNMLKEILAQDHS